MTILKEEGKAGLFFAYDSSKKYTPADRAVAGAAYTCPVCGCQMHLTTTKSGKHIFARNPKQLHTNPRCYTIEQSGVERTFQNLDPEKFISSLCHVSSRQPKAADPSSGKDSPTAKAPSDTIPEDGQKLSGFSSLKQIADSGITFLNYNDRQGEHYVSDFLMSYKYAGQFFANPDYVLGSRIVLARYSGFDAKTNSIFFSIFWKDNGSGAVRFRLFFPKVADFRTYRDKFGSFTEDEKGRTVFKPRYDAQDVLIASDEWNKLDNAQCQTLCGSKETYCKKCCGMYQATFTNSKQIYLIPADH